jgi:hypothetical protein
MITLCWVFISGPFCLDTVDETVDTIAAMATGSVFPNRLLPLGLTATFAAGLTY